MPDILGILIFAGHRLDPLRGNARGVRTSGRPGRPKPTNPECAKSKDIRTTRTTQPTSRKCPGRMDIRTIQTNQIHKSGMPEEKGHLDDPHDANPQIRNVRGAQTSRQSRRPKTVDTNVNGLSVRATDPGQSRQPKPSNQKCPRSMDIRTTQTTKTLKSGVPEEHEHPDDPDDLNPQIRNARGARTSGRSRPRTPTCKSAMPE